MMSSFEKRLHSEYRSTYRWHEYRSGAGVAGGLGGGPGAAAAAGDSQEQQGDGGVVRRAPLPQQPRAPSIEPAMPRRKKYPGLAYKTNEIFEAAAAGLPSGHVQGQAYTLDRARSMERTKYLASRGERRSKSEGPRAAQPQPPRNWTDTVEEKVTSPSIAVKGGAAGLPSGAGTEYRNKFGWPRDEELMVGGSAVESQPRKSVSMGQLKAAQASARRRQPEGGETELEPLMNHADDDGVAPAPDYRKKQACEDFLGQGESTQQRRVAKKEAGDATDGGGQPQVHTTANGTVPNGAPPQMVASEGDSWYKEVLDLRKRAGEYKYRGWGTELAPEHLTELYNKQMDLWYQVSRRSSLSALSLASTNHRIISKDEKDNENKNRTSPSKKPKSFRSAPYQSMNAKLTSADQTDSRRNQRRKLQGHSFDNASVSEGKASTRPSARTSPRKQLNLVIGGRGASVEPASADARSEYRSPKRRPRSADPKALQTQAAEDRRRPSKPSDDDAIPLRSSSAFREPRLLDDSPVVKSPPEPTRVKSPEQMNMRSPDPVNWTVPLDTGKTFTVTQNVNNADDLRQRPGSESRGAWGADSPHSLSLSAPPADLPAVHQPKPDVPKSVEISQRTVNFSKQHAKTPTSPPNLTPIDELKVLDVSKPFLNGNGPSTSSEPSPVNNENRVLSEQKENFEMAVIMKDPETNFKPTEATQKSHGGVDTSVVSGSNSQASVAAEVLEKARTRFDNFWGKKDGANDSV